MKVFMAALNGSMKASVKKDAIATIKPRYGLETFFNGEKMCKETLKLVGNDNFLLDSGAFSYMSGAKITLDEMQIYVNKYSNFIKENNIKYYFEIDVDNIFGLKQVEKWREQLEKETGRKCIPVWHKGRGVEYWKAMCKEYDYVAIGGLVFHVRKREYPLIKKMVDYAYKRGVKVHGLGFTKTKDISEYKFYSIDSASWVKGAVLGQQKHDFVNGQIISTKINGNGKKINLNLLSKHNYIEWCKYQRYMEVKKW